MTVYRTEVPPTTADAQRVLDEHPISASTGRCLRCDTDGACWLRVIALRTFAQQGTHGVLPRRRPGATRPELIGARRVGRPTGERDLLSCG